MAELVDTLKDSEEYKTLIAERGKSKWTLAVAMWVVYYGFILVIAFAPDIFAIKIGDHTSLGIAIGLGVILFSFFVTGIYVKKANKVLEPLTEKLHALAEKHKA